MFLADLSEPQKHAFLTLAARIAQADGEDSEDEREAMEQLCGEMGIPFDIDQRKVLDGINVADFDNHRARVIASLELMRLVYADEYVHEAEMAEVTAICRAMDFPDDWIKTMAEWARRMTWTEDDPNDKSRSDYQAELQAYARDIMNR